MPSQQELVEYSQWDHANYIVPTPSPSPKPSRMRRTYARKSTPPGHIPRPPNAFILFRSANAQKIPKAVTKDQKRISRSIGELWRALSDSERAYWQEQAEQAKRDHALQHPDYVFHPVKKTVAPRKRKVKGSAAADKQRDKEVAKLMRAGKDGDDLARAVLARDQGQLDDSNDCDYDLPSPVLVAPVPLAPVPSILANHIGEYHWPAHQEFFDADYVDSMDPNGYSPYSVPSPLNYEYSPPREQYLSIPVPDMSTPFNAIYVNPSCMQSYDYTHF